MKLRLIERARWTILAVCDERGDCPLVDFLDARGEAGLRMTTFIAGAAEHGPPRIRELCNDLGDGIFEFKKAGLRVLFFYDSGRLIVCSHAYKKQSQKLGPGEKERARRARTTYFEAKREDRLEVIA